MTEIHKLKPILFNTWSMERLLSGRKTQTRRLAKIEKPWRDLPHKWLDLKNPLLPKAFITEGEWADTTHRAYPVYEVGDILWVRETFTVQPEGVMYAADLTAEQRKLYKWRPSLYMRREYCRLFLQITHVRCERLNAIEYGDAYKEGCESVEEYMDVFRKIAGKEVTASNPWVWVYDFAVMYMPMKGGAVCD